MRWCSIRIDNDNDNVTWLVLFALLYRGDDDDDDDESSLLLCNIVS